ncbi:MAG TPA: hypothetical protein VGC88_10030, partial [Terriglobales bacterium]
RAIKRYYHKFGRFPANVDQLENTNNIRFLRKRYVDPFTGKDDWRIIHLGEAKYPPKLKNLAGGQMGQQIGQNIGTSLGGSIGTSPGGLNTNASQSPQGASAGSGAAGPILGAASPQGTQGDQSTQGDQPQPIGGVGASSTSLGQSGQPLIGVAIPSTQKSLKVYNEREQYNEWEFIYDPRLENANTQNGPQNQGATGPNGNPRAPLLPGAQGGTNNPNPPANPGNNQPNPDTTPNQPPP